MEVVHDDDERARSASASNSLRAAQKVSSLVRHRRRRCRAAVGQPLRDQLGLLLPEQRTVREPGRDARRGRSRIRPGGAHDVAHDLGQRPVGDALSVGQAVTVDDGREPRRPSELAQQPGLAHPGLAEHGQQVARSVARPRRRPS